MTTIILASKKSAHSMSITDDEDRDENEEILMEIVRLIGTLSAVQELIPAFIKTKWVKLLLALIKGGNVDAYIFIFVHMWMEEKKDVLFYFFFNMCFIEKYYENDLVINCLYIFYNFLLAPETRELVMSDPQTLVGFYLSVVYDTDDEQLSNVADTALDMISDYDKNLSSIVRQRRFEIYNKEWIKYMENEKID
jgi:hypothetical protein